MAAASLTSGACVGAQVQFGEAPPQLAETIAPTVLACTVAESASAVEQDADPVPLRVTAMRGATDSSGGRKVQLGCALTFTILPQLASPAARA